MKRMITACLICLSTLGYAVPRASAWWPFDCHQCCAKICCRQYNAFSPICCPGPGGYYPITGGGYGGAPWGGSPAFSFAGGDGYVSPLPPAETMGAPIRNGAVAPPAGNNLNSSSSAVPGQNTQAVPPGAAPRPLPAWGAGAASPAAPGYYPGFGGYAPINGAPSYYSGFPGYGPMNGGASYYSGFPGYGPANATPSYYPSYPSYGPMNGTPTFYPNYPSYGPVNGFGR